MALWLPPGSARAAALLAGMAVATVVPLAQSGPREIVEDALRRLRVSRVVVGDQPPTEVLQAADALGDLPPLMEPVSINRGALPMARPCPLGEA